MSVGNGGALGQERPGAGGLGAGGFVAGGFVVESLHGVGKRGFQAGALGNQTRVVVPERPHAAGQRGHKCQAHQDGSRGKAEHHGYTSAESCQCGPSLKLAQSPPHSIVTPSSAAACLTIGASW